MAKKKQEETYEEPKKGTPFAVHLFRFLTRSPVWQIILIAIVAGVVWWKWDFILNWYYENIFKLLGWGIVCILVLLLTLVYVFIRKQFSLFKYWSRWLSFILFLAAAWGVIAYFPGIGVLNTISLGGRAGLEILGGTNTDLVGVLRILVLAFAGLFLFSPRASVRFIGRIISRLVQKIINIRRRRPISDDELPDYRRVSDDAVQLPLKKTVSRRQVLRDEEYDEDEDFEPDFEEEVSRSKPKDKKPLIPTGKTLSKKQDKSESKDAKQVARDVWKKYGESDDVVTIDGWKLPPVEILDLAPEIQFSQADNAERAKLIEDALASYGVEARVVQINAGPTVTQFGVEPGWDRRTKEIKEKDKDGNVTIRVEEVSKTRVKVDRIANLQNDLALALTAPSIRIEAPVPGKGIVGIEVPNTITSMVSLRGVIETSTFKKLESKSPLALALGQGAGGEAVAGDLAKMPHLLIAGATGSGKTVCLNTIICCLLLNNTPNDVRFIMIDPKRVELTTYKGVPHLAAPVIVEPDKAVESLRWLGREMDRRYQVMAEARSRNIASYNKDREGPDRMSYLVLVIDELADLMMTGGDEVEIILCRLAQLSRAVGIHLIVATQRPSVDVITGLIKANFPTRISFAVTSQVDSRTILDTVGAEKLLGSGDMLFLPTDAAKPKRLQGCYVSDAEADRLVFFWTNQHKDEVIPLLKLDELARAAAKKSEHPEDSLMDAARQLAHEHDNISTSFLQRRLRIGYPRAARIMDALEKELEEWEIEEVEEELDDLDDLDDI
ncbi:MAG: DNA translocase FtsK [Dehalococcoidales bacterium]|nr:DNA translocase FtsK [Dehalococcoidales bacterium]